MSKSDTDRFDHTITNLPDTKAAGHKLGTDAVKAINTWMTKNGGNKATIGKLLSLGGIHLSMSEAEKFTRHLKRGVLLAYLTIGGGGKPGVVALKSAFKNENQQALRQRLQAYVTAATTPTPMNQIHRAEGGFGTFEFSQGSWQHANSSASTRGGRFLLQGGRTREQGDVSGATPARRSRAKGPLRTVVRLEHDQGERGQGEGEHEEDPRRDL